MLCLWMGMEANLFRETLPLATLIKVGEDEHEEEDQDDE